MISQSILKLAQAFLCPLVTFCYLEASLIATEPALSPYVIERQKDPVEWHAWSEETRLALQASGKPGLFSVSHELNSLSIAMGEQSFRNTEIARQINEGFFPVVVDKNEHPQLAEFLALYVRNTKQVSGWPLTVVVTPELEPIDGGGYYPPTDDWGSQGISSVLKVVHEQWGKNKRALTIKAGRAMSELKLFHGPGTAASVEFAPEFLKLAVENLAFQYDADYGGFSLPPKEVTFHPIKLLDLAIIKKNTGIGNLGTMRDFSLDALLTSSVRDFIRGGFFAASTESSWSLPDFRKLATVQVNAIAYLRAYPEYQAIVEETAQALVDDFRDERGLYAEQIATGSGKTPDDNPDVWTWSELSEVLTPEELDAFAKAFGVKEEGNLGEDLPAPEALKHVNLLKGSLTSLNDPLVQSARGKLREWSMTRWPSRKEHVSSVATNALVAFGLLNAGERFHPEAAELLSRTEAIYWDDKAKVLKAAAQSGKARSAEASSNGYALYVRALLTAHQKLKEPKYLSLARKLQAVLDKRFWSQEGPYLIAPTDKEYLPPLLSFVEDGFASANAISIHNLRQLTPGKEEAILSHVPEEASYAPEQYPELLVAGLRR